MPNIEELKTAMPVAPIKIVTTTAALPLAHKINRYLVEFRQNLNNSFKKDPAFYGYMEDDYLIEMECPRFGSGEGKAILNTSVRGKDIFILTDVCNHSITYQMNGFMNHMSPDEDRKSVV